MRSILYLHPHFTLPGGAGRFVLETGKELAKRGWKVHIASIRHTQQIVGESKSLSFHELGGPLSSSIFYWVNLPILLVKVIKLVNDINPDIVFAQVFPANWWGFILKLLLGSRVKLVWMCQEPSAFIHSRRWIAALPLNLPGIGARILNPLLKLIDRNLAKFSDGVFANSEFSKKLALNAYTYDEKFIGICYPGVDLDRFRLNDGVKKVPGQLIMCARLTKFKNVDRAIRAVKILLERGVKVTLQVIGEGEEFLSLQSLTEQLGLKESVKFLGAVTDAQMVSALCHSEILIHAAEEEPFGLAPVEAMACGTPVIAIKGGGPAETVIDRETGYLCNTAIEEELAEAVVWITSDWQRLETMGREAVSRAGAFTWGNAADKLECCFEALLKYNDSRA